MNILLKDEVATSRIDSQGRQNPPYNTQEKQIILGRCVDGENSIRIELNAY